MYPNSACVVFLDLVMDLLQRRNKDILLFLQFHILHYSSKIVAIIPIEKVDASNNHKN